MMLHSTNGQSSKVSLSKGITNGIAPDGGLYMPDELPRLPKAFFNNIANISAAQRSFKGVGNNDAFFHTKPPFFSGLMPWSSVSYQENNCCFSKIRTFLL